MSTQLNKLFSDLVSGDDALAEDSARALAELGDESQSSVFQRLRTLFDSGDADVRWWAVRASAGIRCVDALALLRDALKDVDSSVRQCAALGLRYRPHADSVPDLVKALSDSDRLVSELASCALIEIGEPAVLVLIDAFKEGKARSQLGAVRALARIGDERALPALYAAFDEGTAVMEFWAGEGLERMGLGTVFFEP